MNELIHRVDDPIPLDGVLARRWLGGKGASLAEMARMGMPVPPWFTLTTDVWRHFDAHGELPERVLERLPAEVAEIEARTGTRFGDASNPLLLAVRSGGPTSMPGMLDTVLDVGVDAAIARGLTTRFQAPRFGPDVRRRFIESFATVVLGVPRDAFHALIGRRDVDTLDPAALEELLVEYDRLLVHEAGEPISDDPWVQLRASIEGVLRSWRAPRAEKYRDAHGIPATEGLAVTVQAMVFGNLGARSGAGVAFSRNPSTGERALFGEWLEGAQGEDVVNGRHTPQPLTRAQVRRGTEDQSLETVMPETLRELRTLVERLESRYGDMVDAELTIERGVLYLLQCRPAQRTARAAARVAVEMVDEGALTSTQALARVDPASLRQLLTPRLPDPQALAAAGLTPIARGLAASPGAATGAIVFDAAAAERWAGDDLILVRAETSAEDVETMRAVSGILTAMGGLTCHAAVVARAMGKPCVAGATTLHVDYVGRRLVARGPGPLVELAEGDVITIDGGRGLVYAAAVPVEPTPASPHVERILGWADETRTIEVWAEASSERLASVGRSFGADRVLVTGLTEGTLQGVLTALGDVRLVWGARSEAEIAAAAGRLRPGHDALLVVPAMVAQARAAADGLSVLRWYGRSPQAPELGPGDGVVLELDAFDAEAVAALPAGVPWILVGDAALTADPRALAAGGHSGDEPHPPQALVVAPLDVAVGRLRAAQASPRRDAPYRK